MLVGVGALSLEVAGHTTDGAQLVCFPRKPARCILFDKIPPLLRQQVIGILEFLLNHIELVSKAAGSMPRVLEEQACLGIDSSFAFADELDLAVAEPQDPLCQFQFL